MGHGFGALALLALLGAPVAANATLTYNLNPTSDRDAFDYDRDGNVETLRAESEAEVYVVKDSYPGFDGSTSRSAFEFQLGTPLPRPRILSATLYLRIAGTSGLGTQDDGFQIRVHSYAGDGSVNLADMFVDNAFLGPAYWDDFAFTATPEWPYNFAIDVKPALLALNPSEDYLGLMFEGLTSNGGVSFFSKESSYWPGPLLRILVAVPEPGTLALLGLGLVGLSMTRRRKVN